MTVRIEIVPDGPDDHIAEMQCRLCGTMTWRKSWLGIYKFWLDHQGCTGPEDARPIDQRILRR